MSAIEPPTTRLSATADELGWLKSTRACEPMLKLCQLMMARALDWLTSRVAPDRLSVTWP